MQYTIDIPYSNLKYYQGDKRTARDVFDEYRVGSYMHWGSNWNGSSSTVFDIGKIRIDFNGLGLPPILPNGTKIKIFIKNYGEWCGAGYIHGHVTQTNHTVMSTVVRSDDITSINSSFASEKKGTCYSDWDWGNGANGLVVTYTGNINNIDTSTALYVYMVDNNINWGNPGSTTSYFQPDSFSVQLVIPSFTLTTEIGNGVTLNVNRTYSKLGELGKLNNGAAIFYQDILEVSYEVSQNYNLDSSTINNISFDTETLTEISSDTSIIIITSPKQLFLTINESPGLEITIERSSSEKVGALLGKISKDQAIYYNDNLIFTYILNEGYDFISFKINESDFISGNSIIVVSDIIVDAVSKVKSFSLTVSKDSNSNIEIERTASPKAEAFLGNITAQDVIYHGDILKIIASVNNGFVIKEFKLNNKSFIPGNYHTVSGAITLKITSEFMGTSKFSCYIYDDSEKKWNKYRLCIYSNDKWTK